METLMNIKKALEAKGNVAQTAAEAARKALATKEEEVQVARNLLAAKEKEAQRVAAKIADLNTGIERLTQFALEVSKDEVAPVKAVAQVVPKAAAATAGV
jgi:hypothetical protein